MVFAGFGECPDESGGGLDSEQSFCRCPSLPHEKQAP